MPSWAELRIIGCGFLCSVQSGDKALLCTGSAKQLGLQKSSIAGRSNGLKGHDVSPLASKDEVNFIGSFFLLRSWVIHFQRRCLVPWGSQLHLLYHCSNLCPFSRVVRGFFRRKRMQQIQNDLWALWIYLPQILLYVLLVGHFPFNDWSMPSEQTEMDRIIGGSVGQGPKVWGGFNRHGQLDGPVMLISCSQVKLMSIWLVGHRHHCT